MGEWHVSMIQSSVLRTLGYRNRPDPNPNLGAEMFLVRAKTTE